MTTESNSAPVEALGAHSNEPSVDQATENERHKRTVELAEALGLSEINNKLTVIIKAVENHETALLGVSKWIENRNEEAKNQQPAQGKKPANLKEQLQDNQEILMKVVERIFPEKKRGDSSEAATKFLNEINTKSQREALESLDIVSLINKKVKGKLVQDIAGDIAETVTPPVAAVVHAPG